MARDDPGPAQTRSLDTRVQQEARPCLWGGHARVPGQSPGRYVAALGMVRTDEGHSGNVVLAFDLNGRVVAGGVPFGEFSRARGWSPTADVFAYAAGEPPYQIDEARLLDVSTGEDRLS